MHIALAWAWDANWPSLRVHFVGCVVPLHDWPCEPSEESRPPRLGRPRETEELQQLPRTERDDTSLGNNDVVEHLDLQKFSRFD